MFKLPAQERLKLWKKFRDKISQQSFEIAINEVEEFWKKCPFTPFYLPENPINWPDPWQLIIDNTYCDLAKVLGMLYTLHLSSHEITQLNPCIKIYVDNTSRYQYHLAELDNGKYVLNLNDVEILNKKHINQLKLLCCYTAADLQLEKY